MTTSTFNLTDSNGSNTIKNSSVDQWNRSLERALDEAAYTGDLNLNGRKLREFPHSISSQTKCDLSDTVTAGSFDRSNFFIFISLWLFVSFIDLSRNRFTEFPRILCSFFSLERLNLYHNAIKSIPEQIVQIHMLKILDLRFFFTFFIESFWKNSMNFSCVLVEINLGLFQRLSVNYKISKFYICIIINSFHYLKKSVNWND